MNDSGLDRKADQARAKGFCVVSHMPLGLLDKIVEIEGLGWVDAALATDCDLLDQLLLRKQQVERLAELDQEIADLCRERNWLEREIEQAEQRLGFKRRRRS